MKLRVGIVGAGSIADTFHLPGWSKVEGAEVVCLCDLRLEAAQALAEKYSINSVYTDLEEMLREEDFDVLTVCTPHALHHKHIIEGLEAGKHVLVEKPITIHATQVDDIIQTSRNVNRKVMCAQHQRFRGITQRMRELLDQNPLGHVYYARAQALEARSVPARNDSYTDKTQSGGGVLLDLGAHIIDMSWWMMGKPKPVQAFAGVFSELAPLKSTVNSNGQWSHFDVEEFVTGQIRFENGAMMTIEVSYLLNCAEREFNFELFGTEGGFRWPDLVHVRPTRDAMLVERHDTEDPVLASIEQLRHFADCVRKDTEPCIPLSESRTVMAMIDALYESGRTGSVVTVA